MSEKRRDCRVIRKGSGAPFSSPRPPSLVEQREEEQVGKNRATFSKLPRMEGAKKQAGQLLLVRNSSSSFIFARFLDPPATKSQLIYNDSHPLPLRKIHRSSEFIYRSEERKKKGEKKESSLSPPRIIRYLFRTKRSRTVSYLFFSIEKPRLESAYTVFRSLKRRLFISLGSNDE